jgi:hypothetical protein
VQVGLGLSAVLELGCAGSSASHEPPPSTESAGAEPVAPLPHDPRGDLPEPEPVAEGDVNVEPVAAASQPAVGTGIPICDEYLDLYARCEQHLMPEIMAGNRRFHHAEAGSLRYQASTPEAAGLPSACETMLEALKLDCPEQHRQPPP